MPYLASELISDAWYLSGIVSRGLETVEADQTTDGLKLLNFLISRKSVEFRKIPYYAKYDFVAVPGQETYFIPNLVEIDTFTFFIQSIRYSITHEYRKRYWGSARAQNIQTLPFSWNEERTLGGMNLYLYFSPDQNYPLQIWGRFTLGQVELFDDLETQIELFYIDYLRYDLANYMCEFYCVDNTPANITQLKSYEKIIAEMSPYDFSMTKMSTLQRARCLNYADVNIGRGWGP